LEDFITHTAFMKLVKPALGHIAAADARPISNVEPFMVFTTEWIYYRFPTEKEVKRLKQPRGDLLRASCTHIIANIQAGLPMPEDCEARLACESEWLKKAFRKHDAPEEPVPPAPQSSTPMLYSVLQADGTLPAAATFKCVPVKLEFPSQRFRHLCSSAAFIDLSDAPPCSFAAASAAAFLLPPVGETPDEVELEADSSGGTSNNSTCLIVSLQNLGLPVSCNFPWSILSLLWGYSSPAFGDIVHDAKNAHFFALQAREGFFLKMDDDLRSLAKRSLRRMCR
jgi:hypothetical protein